MSSDRIAISVKNVSKDFNLPHLKTNSIKDIFVHPLRVFGNAKKAEVQHALKDISFDIKEGEFFGIVGRNGSGKSTLLKIIAEIYQPTKGKVSVAGRLVPFIELGVGFNPELTGRENVYLSCALNGFSTAEVDAMYDDIVEFAELGEFMDQKLKNYSSGMQVRLAFSVATRSNADVLLIDEVLAVGDADFQRKCFNYFKELKRNKKTVIFVSHDMDAVNEYCDRGMLIEDGVVKKYGVIDGVSQEYRKLFGDSSTNLVETGDETRWGNGDATYQKSSADVSEDLITLRQTIAVNKPVQQPLCLGYRIRSIDGTEITGTNTKIEKTAVRDVEPGEQLQVTWKVDNILADGKYLIDLALLSSDGLTVYEWWNGAETIQVNKSRFLPYNIDIENDVTVK